jgi:Cys-rich protein (TIGR01571 family)
MVKLSLIVLALVATGATGATTATTTTTVAAATTATTAAAAAATGATTTVAAATGGTMAVTGKTCTDSTASECDGGCCIMGQCGTALTCKNLLELIKLNLGRFLIAPCAGAGIALLFYAYFLCCKGDDGLEGDNDWEDGHFSCFSNIKVCLFTLCCPCISWAHNISEAKLGTFIHAGATLFFFLVFPQLFAHVGRFFKWGMRNPLSVYFTIYQVLTILCGLGAVYTIYSYRRKIVGLYKLSEGDHCSFAWVCLCPLLSIMQEGRQIESNPVGLTKDDEYDE